jgi:hydrogenase nickel incorporation protein HypA/HybF
MHELSLSSAIVDTVVRHAAGRRVTAVNLRIGTLRQVVPASLEFYFEVVARDTVCDGARLDYELVAASVACEACGHAWELAEPLFVCPECSRRDVRVVAGDELEVDSIVIQEEEACIAPT